MKESKFYIVLRFYLLLIFLYFSDMTILLSMIWASYKITNSSSFLGIILSISIIIPFAIKKFFPKIDLLKLGMRKLFFLRIVIYSIFLISYYNGFLTDKYGFTLLSIFLGILNLSTLSTFESTNAKLVISGYISKKYASRIMQTVLQVGAFSGALIGGNLLNKYSFSDIILWISILDIIVCFLGFWVYINPIVSQTDSSNSVTYSNSSKKSKYIPLCISLGLIGLHISAFNILTPVIFQKINLWDSTMFGLASGLAGVGAFCAAFINIDKFKYLLPSISIIIFDILFCFSSNQFISITACFFIGFSINTVRINIRDDLISLSNNNQEAEHMGALSATYYSIFQATTPMAVGFLVSDYMIGVSLAPYLLPLAGIIILLSALIKSNKDIN
ncbi:MFS transporter [Xenorhabdus beddingii]|uniref:MFS transporter n=1 Tax=Xenorhabdus beddingii TaxID=40578 RepID=UPI00111C3CFB|nr:MFS transporter [Xenorhabdus beddingii]